MFSLDGEETLEYIQRKTFVFVIYNSVGTESTKKINV